ncbi:MAG: ABC transporter ATP-binding protein [Candidatus Bathyarchaeota archaeon]|nr:ABC transporter ATP-binding protein [Candidatus Bathyarchaeota archaeon]
MNSYFSALIDKTVPFENSKLAKKLQNDLKKSLNVPYSTMNSKEHNIFLFLGATHKLKKPINQQKIKETENRLRLQLNKYYLKNNSKLQKSLKSKQELKETAQIIKDFLKEIDTNLPKVFDIRLKKVISDLPTEYYELQKKSLISLWSLDREHEIQFLLSGWESKVFTITKVKTKTNMEEMVDKLGLLNFFQIFIEPTLIRLREMDGVLERLALGLQGTHYKSNDSKLQNKFEMFVRILSAKLSALENLDKTISSILKLFREPQKFCNKPEFTTYCEELKIAVRQISWKINQGNNLLVDVQKKLERCQFKLKNYFDETQNRIKTIESKDEFKLALLNMAELSSDLFVEAELLKMWLDFFGSDLPYFTFQNILFSSQIPKITNFSSKNIISVRSLSKNYSLGKTTVYALRGVDLDIRKGEFVAIVGNSGAGKTTLLNCMAGLDTPDYGVVIFKGKDLHRLDDSEKSKTRLLDMGFIFQSYALLPHYNTRENVTLPADLAGLSKKLRNRIEDLLNGVGINNQATQYPSQLSGGQMQRVAIARALTNKPTVLFADEPTGDLDSETGKQVMELIESFHQETKTTIIMITHEKEIADYAERQIILEDGLIQ